MDIAKKRSKPQCVSYSVVEGKDFIAGPSLTLRVMNTQDWDRDALGVLRRQLEPTTIKI